MRPLLRKIPERGFTLIELMVVVAIVGILTAVAYPSYQAHMVKGNRVATQSFLMDVAQRQQQYLLDNRSYAADLATLGVSPPTEVSKYYTITVTSPGGTPPTFSVAATPIAGTTQASDGGQSLDNTGQKLGNGW